MTDWDQHLHALRGRLGGAALSAAAVRDGTELFAAHTPAEPRFPIYSLTKTYIAALTLLTVRAGRLALDDTLTRHAPDVPEARHISIRLLLGHRAGLPDYGALADYRRAIAEGAAPWTFDEFADRTYRRGLLFPPGHGWAYANPGYALLVRLLEQIWQRPLAELLQTLVTEPLGLSATRLADTLDAADICPATSPLLSRDGTPRAVKTGYAAGWVWHRLIVSDARDSVHFLEALLARRWLGDSLTDAMTSLVPVAETHPPWTEPSYGLGLMGELHGARGAMYGHNGGGPGYATSAYHVARRGVTVAVIAATEDADAVLDAALHLHDAVTA